MRVVRYVISDSKTPGNKEMRVEFEQANRQRIACEWDLTPAALADSIRYVEQFNGPLRDPNIIRIII